MGNFFLFTKMYTLTLIRILYVIGILIITIIGFNLMESFGGVGWAVIIFGNVLWRLLCEVAIISFRLHETVESILTEIYPAPQERQGGVFGDRNLRHKRNIPVLLAEINDNLKELNSKPVSLSKNTREPLPADDSVRYEVGDRGPAGGIVFYDKGNSSDGWRYQEAWIADDGSTQWKTAKTSTPGSYAAIGTGYANTYNAMAGTDHPAAERARNANHGGFNDWFLPSKDELDLLYQKRGVIGNFAPGYYWSSSESDSGNAWGKGFRDGVQDHRVKTYVGRVRVVRAFNPSVI